MRATNDTKIAKLTKTHEADAATATVPRPKTKPKSLAANERPKKDYTGESTTKRIATRGTRAAGSTLRAQGHAAAKTSDITSFLDRHGLAHDITRDGITAGLSKLPAKERAAFITWFEGLSDTNQHSAMVAMRSDAFEDRRIIANPADFVRSLSWQYKPVPPRWRELGTDPMAHATVRESVNATVTDMAARGVVGYRHETTGPEQAALADTIRNEFLNGLKLLDSCLAGEILEAFERWPMHARQELVQTFVMPFEGKVESRQYSAEHAQALTHALRDKLDTSDEMRAFESATEWYQGRGTVENAANDAAVINAALDLLQFEDTLKTYPHSQHTRQVLSYFWETASPDSRIDDALRAIAEWPTTLKFDDRQAHAELGLMRRGQETTSDRIAAKLGERNSQMVRKLAEIHCDGKVAIPSALTDTIRTRVASDAEFDTFIAKFVSQPAVHTYFRDAGIHGPAVDAALEQQS